MRLHTFNESTLYQPCLEGWRPMYHIVHQGKLVVLRGTPSKPVVTVVQQLVLKNGYHTNKQDW